MYTTYWLTGQRFPYCEWSDRVAVTHNDTTDDDVQRDVGYTASLQVAHLSPRITDWQIEQDVACREKQEENEALKRRSVVASFNKHLLRMPERVFATIICTQIPLVYFSIYLLILLAFLSTSSISHPSTPYTPCPGSVWEDGWSPGIRMRIALSFILACV